MSELNQKYIQLIADNLEKIEKHSCRVFNKNRAEAIENFKKRGLPSIKNESYKYTNLLPLYDFNWHLPNPEIESAFSLDDIFSCDVPEIDTDMVITLNGRFVEFQGNKQNLPEGAVIGSLAQMSEEYPELIEKYLFEQTKDEQDSLISLNTALAVDGIFMYVPKNSVFDKPIQIVNLLTGNTPLISHKRNLIIADENSKCQIVICDHTINGKKFLDNSISEIVVKQNAKLEYYNIQNQHNESAQISSVYTNVYKNGEFYESTISLHGGLIRNNLIINLIEEGAHADASGLSLTDQNQHIDNHININHIAANCTSNQFLKSVLDEQSTTVFTGRILVKPNAQHTNAYQSNKSLLITDKASSNSRPQLEIYADDVKCSHGASTGQIDEDAMFYLQQRGIDKKEARLLLMYAFAFEVIQKIKIAPLAVRIQDLINQRLRGDLSQCNNCNSKCQ